MGRFRALVEHSKHRIPLPIATFPAVALTQCTVTQLVTDAHVQAEAQLALQRRLGGEVLLTCMDLSVEAETFGSAIRFSEDEVPSVIGQAVTSPDEISSLPDPSPGDGRTGVYLETVRRLRANSDGRPVLAGMIGPFSLAGRLFGVSECLLATATEPELVEALLDRTTGFLLRYARAMKTAGADGVLIAEPTAGLLSPRALGRFSSACIRKIVEGAEDDAFDVVLHNCGASAHHLDFIAQSGASIFHFGKPMAILAALQKLPGDAIVCGNLDPSAIFVQSSPGDISRKTRELLEITAAFPRFVPSSGCDIPAATPLENIEAFVREVRMDRGLTPA